MAASQSVMSSDLIDLEAEILRYLLYEGKATPCDLSSVLMQDVVTIDACLDDLTQRKCIFEYFTPTNTGDDAVYCITKRVRHKLKHALSGHGRYKLRSFWLSFNRDDVVWLSHHARS